MGLDLRELYERLRAHHRPALIRGQRVILYTGPVNAEIRSVANQLLEAKLVSVILDEKEQKQLVLGRWEYDFRWNHKNGEATEVAVLLRAYVEDAQKALLTLKRGVEMNSDGNVSDKQWGDFLRYVKIFPEWAIVETAKRFFERNLHKQSGKGLRYVYRMIEGISQEKKEEQKDGSTKDTKESTKGTDGNWKPKANGNGGVDGVKMQELREKLVAMGYSDPAKAPGAAVADAMLALKKQDGQTKG